MCRALIEEIETKGLEKVTAEAAKEFKDEACARKVDKSEDEMKNKIRSFITQRRVSRQYLKPSTTLKISPISFEELPKLREVLAQFGVVKTMNAMHITKGYQAISNNLGYWL